MDSFIVRIHRRKRGKSDRLLGVVENVDGKISQSFRSRDELWEILAVKPGTSGESKKKNRESD